MPEPARRALLIATSRYRDPSLPDLPGATNDATELATVLADEAVGGFDVHTVLDPAWFEVAAAVEDFLQGCRLRDLVLLYFTGHGVKASDGKLYFAAADTKAQMLRATAVSAPWVNEALDACRSRRQIVLLDCCHSGAFGKGIKAGAQAGSTQQLSERGRVILTASDSIQFALEQAEADDLVKSVFTTCLVHGLRTGEADVDGDGRITLDDLFDYIQDAVHRKNPQQTPEMTAVGLRGEFLIARNPHVADRPLLPPGLGDAMIHPAAHVREHAVAQLREILSRADNLQSRHAVLQALQLLRADDSHRVSEAASAALKDAEKLAARRYAAPSRARPQEPRQPVSPSLPQFVSTATRSRVQRSRRHPSAPAPRTGSTWRLVGVMAGLLTVAAVALVAFRMLTPGSAGEHPPDAEPRTPAFAVGDLRWSETTPTNGDAAGGRINAITWYDGQFVAVGEQRSDAQTTVLVWASVDGHEWIPVEDDRLRADGEQSMNGIARAPAYIVAVGTDGRRPDQDAAVWVASEDAIRGDDAVHRVEPDASLTEGHREMRAVVWHDDKFVAVGCVDETSDTVCEETEDGSQRAAVWWSSDGRQWKEVPVGQIEGADQTAMRDIATADDGTLVAVGHRQSGGEASRRAAIWTSTDGGQRWQSVTVPARANSLQHSILGVAAHDDGIVAVGYDMTADNDRDAAVWYSAEGHTWREILPEDNVPERQVILGVAAAGDGFVGVGRYERDGASHGVIWASADGVTWRLQQPDAFPGDGTILVTAAASDDRVVVGGATDGSRQVGDARMWTATSSG